MHRAVLLSSSDEIEEFAIRLPDGAPMPSSPAAATARAASMAAEAVTRGLVGQTVAAHDLTPGIKPFKKKHYVQAGVGHYGVFSGTRWATSTGRPWSRACGSTSRWPWPGR